MNFKAQNLSAQKIWIEILKNEWKIITQGEPDYEMANII